MKSQREKTLGCVRICKHYSIQTGRPGRDFMQMRCTVLNVWKKRTVRSYLNGSKLPFAAPQKWICLYSCLRVFSPSWPAEHQPSYKCSVCFWRLSSPVILEMGAALSASLLPSSTLCFHHLPGGNGVAFSHALLTASHSKTCISSYTSMLGEREHSWKLQLPTFSHAAGRSWGTKCPCFASDLFQSVELHTIHLQSTCSLRWRVMEKRQWMGWTGQCTNTWRRRASGRWGSTAREAVCKFWICLSGDPADLTALCTSFLIAAYPVKPVILKQGSISTRIRHGIMDVRGSSPPWAAGNNVIMSDS